ncbi:hypothetical protein ACIBG8_01235 [Nonomuraea sp. NPDC050556]|uniref:hypothetical protein n=1 Tax=Nonomuraea sp. NPDC050556 TaxID=3364369 RepID=UPI0037995E12
MWVGPYRVVDPEDRPAAAARAVAADGNEVLVRFLDPAARHVQARAVQALRRGRIPHLVEVLGADLSAAEPYIVTTPVPGVPLTEEPLPVEALTVVATDVLRAVAACHAEGFTLGHLTPDAVRVNDGRAVIGLEAWLGTTTDPAADVLAWAEIVTYAGGGELAPPLKDLVAKAATHSAAHLLAELSGEPYRASAPTASYTQRAAQPTDVVRAKALSWTGLLLLAAAVLAPPLVAVFPVAGAAAIMLAAALYGAATVAILPFTTTKRDWTPGRRVAAALSVLLGAPLVGVLRALQQATFLALATGAGAILALAFPNDLQVEITLPRYTALAYALLSSTAAASKVRHDHKGAKGGFLVWLLTLVSAVAAVALVARIGLEPDWWPMTDDSFLGYVESCPELVRWACR